MKVGKNGDRGRRKGSRSIALENEVLVGLSPRQREIALLVGKGCRNKEIAAQLNITERTVKAHVGEIQATDFGPLAAYCFNPPAKVNLLVAASGFPSDSAIYVRRTHSSSVVARDLYS